MIYCLTGHVEDAASMGVLRCRILLEDSCIIIIDFVMGFVADGVQIMGDGDLEALGDGKSIPTAQSRLVLLLRAGRAKELQVGSMWCGIGGTAGCVLITVLLIVGEFDTMSPSGSCSCVGQRIVHVRQRLSTPCPRCGRLHPGVHHGRRRAQIQALVPRGAARRLCAAGCCGCDTAHPAIQHRYDTDKHCALRTCCCIPFLRTSAGRSTHVSAGRCWLPRTACC